MSFLSGIVNFGKKALGFLGGDSIASTLARTAILGYAVNKLSQSALKGNDLGTETNNIDKGVRLQIKPDAEAKIPVLYGSAYFGGNITDAAMTNANKTMWYCLVLSEKTGSRYSDSSATGYTFEDVYWNQQRIVFQSDGITADYTVDRSGTIDRSISGLVKVYLYAGSSSDGQGPDGYTATVPDADTLFPNWTSSTHPMDDLIFALVRVDYSREKNVTGIGQMLFDVRSDMRDPGDVLYDYLTSTVYGAGISSSELKTDDFTALNTYSATSVNYTDEGTGSETLANRYQINGLLDTKNDVLKNAEKITSASGSYLSYDTHEGQWGVVINKAETSSASFDDDNILGNISVGGTGLQDLYNSVKVAFPHRDLRDSADFVKIEIPNSDRNSNEPDNTLNITYDIINEPVQAEVLGFIELKQARVDLIIQFETDFSYINLKAGDVIDVTNDRYGFSSKLFRIITITERQDTDGALSMSITALEYDSDVYSTQDITRYTRSDDDGIITIGSIGIPGTPQVTKFERSNRPRIEIETTAPTGVVEGIEFWITFDYQESDDAQRSYTLIGTKRPVGGGVYTSGTEVTFEYPNLNAQDFYIKTRGVNTTTTGPFSTPSGLVEFVPEQVPDAVTPDTSILDSGGGLATALGIVSLLNNLDGLFGGESGSGSLFEKVFETFEEVTGFDIVGETTEGSFVVPTNISIQDEGTEISSSVSVINFTGANVEASADGTVITVNHTDDGGDDGGGDDDSPKVLNAQGLFPPDRVTHQSGISESNPNLAPITGSYFVRYTFSDSSPIYTDLQAGSGSAYLYKSDGTLVETLASSSAVIDNGIVELPFAARDLKTDYYILIDDNFVTYCGVYNSIGISSASNWNFNTPEYSTTAYSTSASAPTTFSLSSSVDSCGNTLTVTGDIDLVAGSGSATIGGVSVNASSFTISGSTATYDLTSLSKDTAYNYSIPQGFFTGTEECATGIPSSQTTGSFTTPTDLTLTGYTTEEGDFEPSTSNTNVHQEAEIVLNFNQNVSFGTGSIQIYKSGGTLHQDFDVEHTFSGEGVNELLWIEGSDVYINPTVDLEKGANYYLLADSGTLVSSCNVNWAGESSTTAITWTVDTGPEATLDTDEVENGFIELDYDRDVSVASGNVYIKDSNQNIVATIASTSSAITIV